MPAMRKEDCVNCVNRGIPVLSSLCDVFKTRSTNEAKSTTFMRTIGLNGDGHSPNFDSNQLSFLPAQPMSYFYSSSRPTLKLNPRGMRFEDQELSGDDHISIKKHQSSEPMHATKQIDDSLISP